MVTGGEKWSREGKSGHGRGKVVTGGEKWSREGKSGHGREKVGTGGKKWAREGKVVTGAKSGHGSEKVVTGGKVAFAGPFPFWAEKQTDLLSNPSKKKDWTDCQIEIRARADLRARGKLARVCPRVPCASLGAVALTAA